MGRDRKGAVHDPTRSGSEPVDGLRRLRRVRATARSGKELGPTARLVALLGGEAGLRCGEIIGLEWSDVDLVKRQMCIQRSEWRGHVTAPKGGRLRYVPMTARLASAMRDHRHLKGPRVLRLEDGLPLTQDVVGEYVRKAGRKAGVPASGAHRLRHTFCSHLTRVRLKPDTTTEIRRRGEILETRGPRSSKSAAMRDKWRGGRDSNPRPPA